MKSKNIILTDGGLETDLIFNHQIELPHFAAFPLLENPKHEKIVRAYYKEYLEIAKKHNSSFILESATYRASKDWGFKLGYSEIELDYINRKAIKLLFQLKKEYQSHLHTILVSGCIGPRGDGYNVDEIISVNESENYHTAQIKSFANANADLVSAFTMNSCNEALGIVKAAKKNNIDVVISFTVELDGKLPSGESLEDCISKIDETTDSYVKYYMINCAYPTHFIDVLKTNKPWKNRIQGIRANASCKSHAELDESTELDTGDKNELGNLHQELTNLLPSLQVFGGCCGTDATHIESIYNCIN